MRVGVVRDLCIGAANCVAAAPTVFELDAEDKAVVLDPDSVGEEDLWRAAKSCPTKAIVLEGDEGKQVYP